ncbi:MAG: CapA family protein [Acidobacteriota bacterium]
MSEYKKIFILVGLVLAIAISSYTYTLTTTAQSTTSARATNALPKDSIVFAAVGDIMMGSTYPGDGCLPPNDGADMLAEITPILSAADIAFGNLEGPMIDGGVSSKCGPKSRNCYAFRVPTRYGKYLKEAGFDIMSLANNHASDFGSAGIESSKRVLDSLGIAHAAEVGDIAYLNVKGKKIAVIAFATNNVSYNLNDIELSKRVVAETATKADIVVVSFHGGGEGATRQNVPHGPEIFLGEQRGDLRKFTHAVIDAGADLVIGHGPHVVRGMEIYKDRLIAYSLGNFATYCYFSLVGPNGLSLILEANIGLDGKFLGGRIHAAKQLKPGGPRLDPQGEVISMIRQLSQQDFSSGAVLVKEDGLLSLP